MPVKKSPPSLRSLILQKTIDYLCREVQNCSKLMNLPVILRAEILTGIKMSHHGRRLGNKWPPILSADVFIHKETKEFSFYFAFDVPMPQLIEKICTCKNLTKLDFQHTGLSIMFDEAKQLFSSLPNVEHLNICKHEWFCDDLLTIIGDNCPRLTKLEMKKCLNVTDKGLRNLCMTKENSVRDLEIQDLNIDETSVTPKGCVFALKTLIRLKNLNYWVRRKGVNKLLSTSCKSGNVETYGLLETLYMDFREYYDVDWFEFSKMFPKLKNCTILDNAVLNSLVKAPTLRNWMGSFAHLFLFDIQQINVEEIDRLCPRLVELTLNDCTFSMADERRLFMRNLPFKNLVTLELNWSKNFSWDVAGMRKDDIFFFLSYFQNVVNLYVSMCQILDDSVVENLVESNVLKCLESLHVDECHLLSFESVMQLVKVESPLNKMTIFKCEKIKKSSEVVVREIVENNNLQFQYNVTDVTN